MISVTADIFFDRQTILDRMDKKTARVLSSTGAYARIVMRRGMRRRKRVSNPGDFPSAHAGQLKELIFFGYDAQAQDVVIGPTLFGNELSGGKTVPELLNEGGTVLSTRRYKSGKTRVVRQHYRARPFVALTAPHAANKLAENMEKFDL